MTKSWDAPEKGGVPRADAGPSGGLMDRSKGRDGASPGTKESACNAGDAEGVGSIPAGKIPWRRKWQPTPVFLPAKSHGQRSPMGYSPWGRQEADNTEATEQARTKRERESRLEEASELGEQEQQD